MDKYETYIRDLDCMVPMSYEIQKALNPIIDNYSKKGFGYQEIILGLAHGVRGVFGAFCYLNEPTLNTDEAMKIFQLWSEEKETDYYSFREKVFENIIEDES